MASSFFDRKMDPLKQAGFIFLGALVMMLGGWLFSQTGLLDWDKLFPWSIATAFTLIFALLNSVLSLNADSFTKYWGRSVYSYMLLALCNGLAAWLISGISLNEAGSYKFIYLVVTFGFLVFLSMVNFIKQIVQFAEREEWNQPRRRR